MGKKQPPHTLLRQLIEFLRARFGHAREAGSSTPDESQQSTPSCTRIGAKTATISESPLESGQQLFVVWDAIGDGRLVGVFDNELLAREILSVNSHYYRYYRCQFGHPTADAIDWLDQEGKAHLANIMDSTSYFSKMAQQPAAKALGIVREAARNEIERMVEIWLTDSIKAHNFISSDFWHKNAEEMRQKYLPAAENWVYCEHDRILGFFSLQQSTLAALFVATGHQGRGIGKLLLDKAMQLRKSLSLTVYEANTRAINFYSHNGFKVMIAQKDPHTGHSELLMSYP
ncbi:MAG: N-acetyltransferase [Candidatus Riflebacteria bacterium]|nr:N-acetyltransferase [Candidatus Riflebacteria bacterium]